MIIKNELDFKVGSALSLQLMSNLVSPLSFNPSLLHLNLLSQASGSSGPSLQYQPTLHQRLVMPFHTGVAFIFIAKVYVWVDSNISVDPST